MLMASFCSGLLLSVADVSPGLSGSFQRPVSFHCGDSRMGGWLAVRVGVYNHCRLLPSCMNTVVYPVSANFGMLMIMSVECNPGTMFISRASGQSLCLRSIFFIALLILLYGKMNIFFVSLPVSSRASLSSAGAASNIALVYTIPFFFHLLFSSFHTQCTMALLAGLVTTDVKVIVVSILVVIPDSGVSSCSSTRQVSRDQ